MSNYFSHPALSNSKLSQFEQETSGRDAFDSTMAFRTGHLCDAFVTEPKKLDYINYTIDELPHQYTKEEFAWGVRARKAFYADPVCASIAKQSEMQIEFYVEVDFDGIGRLKCKCKYDGWLPLVRWGWDLKTTQANSEAEFDAWMDTFSVDRQIFFYMEVSASNKFCIFAINKRNFRIFKRFVNRGDACWQRGREKCLALVQKYTVIYGGV
jgi:PDDEXK-like domain of unknown function (DUF3799)